ncbi:2-aminoethylphosphonate aminotransferase [Fusibacter ferrireducens]|uniref:2-aminoethylphosphonate--pyruvate transaminase n=1 Tax=Fusibacter ferrireducens TaxID=2785058 RepID=A0ABS0A006_9FIRM|nr:2-aminoethylphosphonate aminotransferase [Fusibacter ferrireducens]MBF4695566.1 2-aminoethylphosphonate aminotransferase [Fusibacter ferrireducens]
MKAVKRKILLNPGPATTTDTVKKALVVEDICPREKDFLEVMKWVRDELVKIVHGDLNKYTSVLFCGSGTINIDVIISSILPAGKKMLIINNGVYSARAVEASKYYDLPVIELKLPYDRPIDVDQVKEAFKADSDIGVVYATHHETGTGILNPIREIGAVAHENQAVFAVDTTSTYGLIPMDIEKDQIDFLMASAQKGLSSMTGLSFIVCNRKHLEASKMYPKHSYYCNLYRQYEYFERTGEMQFTPPVQIIYATKQAIIEYWEEGEAEKFQRHRRVWEALYDGIKKIGLEPAINKEWQSGLVVSVKYPVHPNWDFKAIHDYCYQRDVTLYASSENTFRLCSLGAIDLEDVAYFLNIFKEALIAQNILLSFDDATTKA